MKRNLMSFEAPQDMTEQVKKVAEDTYTSTSAVCRQALAQYLNQRELPYSEEMTSF
jgi:predicted transcriptional regulator